MSFKIYVSCVVDSTSKLVEFDTELEAYKFCTELAMKDEDNWVEFIFNGSLLKGECKVERIFPGYGEDLGNEL